MGIVYHKKYLVSTVAFLLLFLIVNAQTGYYLDGPKGLRAKVDMTLNEIDRKLSLIDLALQTSQDNYNNLSWAEKHTTAGGNLQVLTVALKNLKDGLESQDKLLLDFQTEIKNDAIGKERIDQYLSVLYDKTKGVQSLVQLTYVATHDLLSAKKSLNPFNTEDEDNTKKANALLANTYIDLNKIILLFTDDSQMTKDEKKALQDAKDLVLKNLNRYEKQALHFLMDLEKKNPNAQKLILSLMNLSQSYKDLDKRKEDVLVRMSETLLGVRPMAEEPPAVVPAPVSPPGVIVPPVPDSVSSDPFVSPAPTNLFLKDTDTFKKPRRLAGPERFWRKPTRGINDLVTRAKQDFNLYFGLRRVFVVRQNITHMEIEVCDEQNVCRTIIIAIPPLSENNQDPFVTRVRKALLDYFDAEKARKANQSTNVKVIGTDLIHEAIPKFDNQGWRPSSPLMPFGGPVDENQVP